MQLVLHHPHTSMNCSLEGMSYDHKGLQMPQPGQFIDTRTCVGRLFAMWNSNGGGD